jgi:cell pole-organizing protein PopZ
MAQAAKAQEPSMEEILASIRRIIADDETKPAARAPEPPKPAAAPPPPPPRPAPPPPPAAAAPAPPPPPSPPPKPLSNEVDTLIAAAEPQAPEVLDLTEEMAAPASPSGFRTIDGRTDVVFTDPPAAPGHSPNSARLLSQDDRLLSGSATAAVDSAFNSLAQTVLVQNARTLEDLVREMLRPMLKSWLDDNLPGLVERLVRAEIERVSRGRS